MLLKDLRQYTIESTKFTGQGALWQSFLMHSSYTKYLTNVFDGFSKNFDTLAVGTPDLLCNVGHNWHVGDYAGIEQNPYEDPDLMDLVASCIDPDHKGGYQGSYEAKYFVKEFCLGGNMEVEHERKLVEAFISYIGFEGSLESFLEALNNTPEEKWEEINEELSEDYEGYIEVWIIHPSTQEKRVQLQEAFEDFPIICTDDVFWNLTVTYDGEGYHDFDYDEDELAKLIELYSDSVNDIQIDKYNKVLDVFSTSKSISILIAKLENNFFNRKDVLF